MVTGSVIGGISFVKVSVCGPEPIENVITSAPGFALAAWIAALKEPGTLSAVVVTVKVIIGSDGTTTGARKPSRRTTRSDSASLLTRELTSAAGPPSSSTAAETTSGVGEDPRFVEPSVTMLSWLLDESLRTRLSTGRLDRCEAKSFEAEGKGPVASLLLDQSARLLIRPFARLSLEADNRSTLPSSERTARSVFESSVKSPVATAF